MHLKSKMKCFKESDRESNGITCEMLHTLQGTTDQVSRFCLLLRENRTEPPLNIPQREQLHQTPPKARRRSLARDFNETVEVERRDREDSRDERKLYPSSITPGRIMGIGRIRVYPGRAPRNVMDAHSSYEGGGDMRCREWGRRGRQNVRGIFGESKIRSRRSRKASNSVRGNTSGTCKRGRPLTQVTMRPGDLNPGDQVLMLLSRIVIRAPYTPRARIWPRDCCERLMRAFRERALTPEHSMPSFVVSTESLGSCLA